MEHIPWYTITDDFDKDFDVDEWHGTNAFLREGDRIFRTYFINARGDEQMGSTWNYLDITALGRQEEWRTRRRVTRKPRRTSGGTTTTPTARASDHPVSGVSWRSFRPDNVGTSSGCSGATRPRPRRQNADQGVTASDHWGQAARPRPPAARQASNKAATCAPEAAWAAASGAAWPGLPALARSSAAEPERTTASHPSVRARAATRPASRPSPSVSAAPSTSPNAAPQVPLARQARSTSAPPGGGAGAATPPRPRRAITA